ESLVGLRSWWSTLHHLRIDLCRRTGLAGLWTTTYANALRGPGRQHLDRTPMEHLAPVVCDPARRLFECDWNRYGRDVHTAYLDRHRLCVDVQQYGRKPIDCDAFPSRAQSGCQFCPNAARWRSTALDCKFFVFLGGGR